MATSEGEKQTCWYVMRDLKRANAKLPAYKQLLNEHFEVFTPMKEQLSVHGGKRTREEVPFIQDLLFVHDTQEAIDPFVEKYPTIQYRFQKGGGYKNPMTVADADMERFIHAVSVSKNPKYYLPGELTPSMCGRHIRIVGGPLDGYEGKLLTVRGSNSAGFSANVLRIAAVIARRESESMLILQTADLAALRNCSSGIPIAASSLPPYLLIVSTSS